MNKVTFTVTATMNQRWVNDFCSLLKWMNIAVLSAIRHSLDFTRMGMETLGRNFKSASRLNKKTGFLKRRYWESPK